MKKLNLFALALLFVGAVACNNADTAAEEAGEEMEQTAEEAAEGMEEAAEDMGEATEEAAEEVEETMEGDGTGASTEEAPAEAGA